MKKFISFFLLSFLMTLSSCNFSSNNSEPSTYVPSNGYTPIKVEKENNISFEDLTYYELEDEVEEEDVSESLNWTAKWIWTNDSSKNNWVRLRKTFDIDGEFSNAIVKVGVESRYWLYINETEVVFEGGLKRGVNRNDGYYDYVDVSSYLKEGRNTICVLAWYWGLKSYSYSNYSTNKPGFIFQLELDDTLIVSNNTWKVKKDVAYQNSASQTGESQPNDRLPEYNISYKATLENDTNWIKNDFDDSSWENATEYGQYGFKPWGYLYKRPIPLTKNFGYYEYNNTNQYKNYTTTSNQRIIMKVGTNIQLCPYFKITCNEENKKILISTETTIDSQGHSIRTYYYTKKGTQEFTSLGYMNGQYVYYDFPSNVTIEEIGYYKTGYDTTQTGSFLSNDNFYNRIWQMSYDTLYVTMRDNFMDCPNRERAQWIGDVTNEMEQIIYSMDFNSYLLYEKSLNQFIGFSSNDILPTVAPIQNSHFELVIQNLCAIDGAWTYYLYSGRSNILLKSYNYFYKYLKLWELNDNGLVNHRSGSWDWMDNDANMAYTDTEIIENAWYYKALTALENMANLFNSSTIALWAQERKESIYQAFDSTFYTTEGYMSSSVLAPDDRANSIAVLSGLVPQEHYTAAMKVFLRTFNSSPYWEKYVLEAMCEMGYISQALSRMSYRYELMANYTVHDNELYSTLWEKWSTGNGTLNHAWSGGPMTVLSKYILGVRPLASNYSQYLIKPDYSTLTDVTGDVPTLKGTIKVDFEYTGEQLTLKVTNPTDCNAIVAIKLLNDKSVVTINDTIAYQNGYAFDTDDYSYYACDDSNIYFSLNSGGKYTIKVA